jgi:hypothetical protein
MKSGDAQPKMDGIKVLHNLRVSFFGAILYLLYLSLAKFCSNWFVTLLFFAAVNLPEEELQVWAGR